MLFQIKYQPSVTYKKAFNVFLRSPKHEEIKFPHKFIFVFPVFNWGDIFKKTSKVGNSGKKYKGEWEWGFGRESCLKKGGGGFKHSTHYTHTLPYTVNVSVTTQSIYLKSM